MTSVGIFVALRVQRQSTNLSRYLKKFSTMTPEEAGQRAYELARELVQKSSSSSPNAAVHIDTLLAHAGLLDSAKTDAVGGGGIRNVPMSPPLHVATTYTREPDGTYNNGDAIYIREDNPTRLLLEQTMYQLETHGGPATDAECSTFAFASGMMAASSIILSHRAPVHVILPKDLYHGVSTSLAVVFERFNVTTSRVDIAKDISGITQHVNDNKDKNIILWMETPSNPLCEVVDISGVCELVRDYKNVTTVVDSTLAPPVITQPLRLGADIVMHSATKYLGGHSDALCGIVTTSPWTEKGIELTPKLKKTQTYIGGVASTFDSWLVLRGLRTLRTRVEKQCSTALQLATFLNDQKGVRKVYYPGLLLDDNPNHHEVAKRQMIQGNNKTLFGGVLSVEMESESMAYEEYKTLMVSLEMVCRRLKSSRVAVFERHG